MGVGGTWEKSRDTNADNPEVGAYLALLQYCLNREIINWAEF